LISSLEPGNLFSMIEDAAEKLAEAQSRGQQISEWVLLANLEFFDDLPDVMKDRRRKLEEALYPGANLTDTMRQQYCECYMNMHGGTRIHRTIVNEWASLKS
jgi:hypothetical protein